MVLSSKHLEGAAVRGTIRLLAFVGGIVLYFWAAISLQANGTQPIVAVHDSEYTRGLENINAFGDTPTGPGTTGKQWWFTDFRYFVMPEVVKEALRSDGTAFTVLGDSNIISGALLTNGVPRFPIVISLASEAIHDSQISQFTNYVAAGGFLFVGSSAFTRTTNGTPRGNFAFANEMGIHSLLPGVANWALNNNYTRLGSHRINNHVPAGGVTWRLPSAADEIPYGVSTSTSEPHNNGQAQASHDIWQVVNSNATVIAQGDIRPFLVVKQYGKGYFIYCAAMQPLLGNGGWAPTMYTYLTLRRSIEWAFESSGLPVAKLSPWPFQYDAAFMVRHDLESFSNAIAAIEVSAQFEFTNGCTGDYYFCTGTLREDMSPTYNTNNVVASLRRAITNYGAIIGPHNGGFTNPMIAGTPASYDYWHWGPDEMLDLSPVPPGFSSGSNFAYMSLSRSFQDIESWLSGLVTNGMRVWCAPYYNGTREGSLNIQSQLGVKITGEQKIAPFPHWSISTQIPGKRFGILQQPPSDWFVGPNISHSMEAGHTVGTVRSGVDFYYNLGALVNFYSHSLSHGVGIAGEQAAEYVTYSMNTNRFPRLWSANAIKIYNWWLQRSNVQISVSHATNGVQLLTTFNIQNATHTNTTVELFTPSPSLFCDLKIYTNGVLAGTNLYRTSGQTIKLRVGNTVTNALLTYYPLGPNVTYYSEGFDGTNAPALPSGWVTTGSNAPAWVSQTSVVDSAPNAAFGASAGTVAQSSLVSPAFNLPTGQSQLTFRHNYDLEAGVGNVGFDGGVIEIKIGTNDFADVLSVGGSFASGGYTHNLDNTTGNPIGGRQAWSGNSSNFITTIVNLPAAASGRTVQFRWRVGSDGGGNRVGWRVDNVILSGQVCLCCAGGTNAPVLPAQTNRTIIEYSTLIVTNTATDADFGDTLFYSLQNPPSGAVIGGNGVFVWTPGGAYGGTTNTITTIVTDGAGLTATNNFNVIVINTNGPPLLPVQTNRTGNELVALSVTNTATDSDVPPNGLSYSLLEAPVGASISAAGVITWTPNESQGPSINTFTTRVVDNGTPPLSATNSFIVTINEVNSPPNLPVQGNRNINELATLTVTNTAPDSDLPANAVTYQLINPPAGAAINSSGIITWTPAGTQGPSTNVFQTVATDNGGPPLSATNSFTVVVNDTATCQYAPLLSQGFEVISSLPNLPSGWISTNDGAQAVWVTQNGVSDAGTNAAFASETSAVGNSYLVSPNIVLQSDAATLTFRHSYDLEAEPVLPVGYDGGVLEIKIGVGNFTDIVAAGGSFVTGGYTHTIDNTFSSPIGGRQAWSGNSGGFVTTTVTVPSSAYGQALQFRWRCATDSAVGGNGWIVDSITVSNLVCSAGTNTPPTLPTQTNRTIAELSLLTVTNTASDIDLPPNTLTYQLVTAPGGAAISSAGIITWTPTEAQGPSTNTFTTVVNDGQASATNSFTVIVTEVNLAPVLPGQSNRTIAELTLLNVTNTATDADLPANTLTYQLINPPSGASISASGVITWTPTEAQGPVTNTITTRVTDGVASATNSFTVIVTEVNVAPVLPAQSNRTIGELTLLTVTNTATDADLPANPLTYQLLNPPAGASISANGVITWTPTEAQGPGTNALTTVVSDGALSATNSFNVIVTEVNVAPVLPVQTQRVIPELATLTVTNTATDSDLPANVLAYQLLSPPAGAVVNSNGVITWTPSIAQGPSTNTITTVVTDGSASATNNFVVIVTDGNQPPVLPTQTNRAIAELTLLTVTNTASDPDIPANTLTYQLLAPPAGAVISTNGVITWTPSEAQGPGTNTLTTVVSDGLASVTNSFVVTVGEVNVAPILPAQTDRVIGELVVLTVTNTATDADLPANELTYQLVNPPVGAVITADGIIYWTPSVVHGPATNSLTTIVSDGAASATNTFTVVVNNTLTGTATIVTLINAGAVWKYLDNGSDQGTAWQANAFNDSSWNSGPAQLGYGDGDEQTVVSFGTNSSAKFMTTYFRRAFSLTNVANFSSAQVRVLRDDGVVVYVNGTEVYRNNLPVGPVNYQTPALGAIGGADETNFLSAAVNPALLVNGTNIVAVEMHQNVMTSSDLSFDLELTGVFNVVPPTLPPQADREIAELATLIVTNTANGNNLSYQLVNAPVGAVIDINGVITWTPTELQGPATNTITTVVSDGIASATNSFAVVVNEVNVGPLFVATPANRSVAELTALSVTNAATDEDLPVNLLTYQLLNAPGGATINSNGIINWTPTEAQGPATNTIVSVVSDGNLSATNSFVVVVTEANVSPRLPLQTEQTVAELSLLTVTNTASDADLPANVLTYQLLNVPPGVNITTNGVITWTPTEAQGPGTNTITTVVSDGQVNATNSFVVVVTEANQSPVLPTQNNQSIAELTLLTVTNTATDADLPANTLAYQLLDPPAGATINSNGVITWTPTEAQGAGTNTLITVVTDGTISVTNSFTVVVTEVNEAPTFVSTPADQVRPELVTMTLTNAAIDADLPANTLVYSLIAPPTGAAIDQNGVFTWTPTEAQGPGTNTITTVVSDGQASATNSFVVVVTEANQSPVLPAQNNLSIAELTLLTVTNTATDADLPANTLAYQLLDPPAGATINSNGVITWAPTEAQGPVTNTITTVVNDGQASATNSFVVVVTEANQSPVLPAQNNLSVAELTLLTVTNTATDADLPANTLAYQLLDPPAGATVDSNGVITWTPTEAQGPGTNTITTVVSDGQASATNSFVVVVTEANQSPGLPVQNNLSIAELTLLTVTNTATDADLPANTLAYQLLDPPAGATINSNGVITWTPTEAQGPGTNAITTVVSDGQASVTNSFAVVVTELNSTPILPNQTSVTVPELTLLAVTNTATDSDLPTNALIYQLLNAPAGATINSNGVITWTPTEAQGPGTNTLITVVTDGTISVTNSFTVVVTEVNEAPTFVSAPADQVRPELVTMTLTNAVIDADLPANTLVYSLIAPPTGAAIDQNGLFTWTPTESQGPSTNVITTVVSDGSLSVSNSFLIIVTEVNSPPLLATIPSRTIHAGTTLLVQCLAEDVLGENNFLTFSLDTAPVGATMNPTNGICLWPTTDTHANTTNAFVVRVTDSGEPAMSDTRAFTVTVVGRPVIQSITLTNGVATVSWSAIAGQRYVLQTRSTLSSSTWADLGGEVISTGATASQTNAVFETGSQFYRVRLAP